MIGEDVYIPTKFRKKDVNGESEEHSSTQLTEMTELQIQLLPSGHLTLEKLRNLVLNNITT